jgi:hypothetical protein
MGILSNLYHPDLQRCFLDLRGFVPLFLPKKKAQQLVRVTGPLARLWRELKIPIEGIYIWTSLLPEYYHDFGFMASHLF